MSVKKELATRALMETFWKENICVKLRFCFGTDQFRERTKKIGFGRKMPLLKKYF